MPVVTITIIVFVINKLYIMLYTVLGFEGFLFMCCF